MVQSVGQSRVRGRLEADGGWGGERERDLSISGSWDAGARQVREEEEEQAERRVNRA